MKSRDMSWLILCIVVVVAVISIVLLYKTEITGEAGIKFNVKKIGQAVRKVPVKISQDRSAGAPQKLTKVPETKAHDPCCLWTDKGMSFHISEAASKYMGFSPYKIGKSEIFDKTDLVFVKKPDFYDCPVKCVKGGTLQNPDVGEKLCVESYKGIPLPLDRQAGLLCVEKQWWLAGGICGSMNLEVPGPPPMPCSGACYPDGEGGCTPLKSYHVPSNYECICIDSDCVIQ